MNEARFHGHKLGNEYAATLGTLYNNAPKAVLAAIAVSFAMRLTAEGDDWAGAVALVREEWAALHRAKIVPQAPPK